MDVVENKEAFLGLIKIPSVTGSEEEEKACAYLERILEKAGIESERIAKIPSRPNLLACIRAPKPAAAPVVLISHIDVAGVDESQWTHLPFGAQIEEGRIFGRGTLDTKHLTMMELYGFLYLKEQQARLKRDVWFLATIDEEGGSSFGMEYVKEVRPELFKNALVINEGGGFPLHINGKDYMTVTVGEKGVCKACVWANGTGGHASAPGEDQAVQKLSAGLERVFQAEHELCCGSRRIWEVMKETVGSETWDNLVGSDLFGYAGQNTIGMRNFQIGERVNVIPSHAEAVLEFRVLPGTKKEDISRFLKKVLDGLPLQYEILSYEPGFEVSFEDEELKAFLAELCKACRAYGFEGEVLPMLALGRTDGRFFGSEGSMVYGCSPLLLGDSFDVVLPKVHGNEESILESSYLFGCKVIKEVLSRQCLSGEE